ncbi:MAG: hypothetical protein QXM43_04660 [Desulfurococcaceae archaeon]
MVRVESKWVHHSRDIRTPQDALISPLPHFTTVEQLLFAEYLRAFNLWGLYVFDVPLQTISEESLKKYDPIIAEQIRYLTAFKIDALRVHDDGSVTLIEVKRRPLLSGIGQLLSYSKLFREQYENPIRELHFVTTFENTAVKRLCEDHNIKYYVISWLAHLGVRY